MLYLTFCVPRKRGPPLRKGAHIRNAKLINNNTDQLVKDVTMQAFREYNQTEDAIQAMKILQKLKGVGPCRASLLLSVVYPDSIPFFSQQLYRWLYWDEKSGWSQEFYLTHGKYLGVLERVTDFKEKHSLGDRRVSAVDVEKVAFVLEHESVFRGK